MEKCENITFKEQTDDQIKIIETQLSKSLQLLHMLHICHCDIKPQNIMFGRNLNKYVFIDFGLSKFAKQDIGFKTLTSFVGTYKSSSPEMKKLYFLNTSNYIDLYFNDLFGLISSIKNIRRNLELIQIRLEEQG